ncbi:ThiF family adenylyltransferase [Paenibacillus solisilvae]|uniref:ThiF family adenylyltransferase n=1 Tax=Paenibacillus solisilvae TaxID=2486751 RepID=A0ABW0VQM9_9BACL
MPKERESALPGQESGPEPELAPRPKPWPEPDSRHEDVHAGREQADWSDRYSRQMRFAPIGPAGQGRLAAARVLIVGCGALGASLAQHMVRAGVGEVHIADRDFVEPSNLQRQMLFDEADALAALPKAAAAADKLRRINSEIRIEPYVIDVTEDAASRLAAGVDLVLDGTDNAKTRLLLSDVCYRYGIPFLYGGVAGAQGMSAMLVPGETACLRCLIGSDEEESGETCDTLGVISPIVELIAAMQAAEALKWLSGDKNARRRTWVTANLWPYGVTEAVLPKPTASCRQCGSAHHGENITAKRAEQGTYSPRAASLCGRDTIQVTLEHSLNLTAMRQTLSSLGFEVTANPYLVRAQLPGGERLVLFSDGRILVQGTQDAEHALALCALYVQEGYDTERSSTG